MECAATYIPVSYGKSCAFSGAPPALPASAGSEASVTGYVEWPLWRASTLGRSFVGRSDRRGGGGGIFGHDKRVNRNAAGG